MSSEDKKKLENSLARDSFYESRTSNMSEFLEPGEKFTDRLQKLVKDSLKRPGLDIQKITIGSTGNASNIGNLTVDVKSSGALSGT